jgi:hypothetical protein
MSDARDELMKVVDSQSQDEAERRDSRILYQALHERRNQIGAINQIPANDPKLSEQILSQARNRSAEISAARLTSGSQLVESASKPVSWWVVLAWLFAVVAVVLALMYLT